jgi:hypothetical protein
MHEAIYTTMGQMSYDVRFVILCSLCPIGVADVRFAPLGGL